MREAEAEVVVDGAHGADRIPEQVEVAHVEEAIRGNQTLVARAQRTLETVGPASRHLGADLLGIDLVAEGAAQRGGEAGERADHLQGISMRENDARVGIDVEESAEAEEMRRGLQHPALASPAELEVLEKPAMRLVCGDERLRLQPRLIRGHVVAGLELEAQERVARDDEALLGQERTQLVDAPEARVQAMEPAQLTIRGRDARIVMMMMPLGRRRREHHLPAERRAMRGVLGEQPVQQGRAGARQSGDEERTLHRLQTDLRMPLAVPLHAQPVREQADHILARRDAAEQAELRGAVEVRDQPLQRLAKTPVAEVVEPGTLPRFLAEQLRVETHEREAGALDHATAAPERARERTARGRQRAHARLASESRSPAGAISSCHAMRPGIPSTSSRTRFASDSASAISGPIPTTRPSIT